MRGAFAQALSHTRPLAGTIAALCLFGPVPLARAQDWGAPARELVNQLRRQVPPPARLAWGFQNRSTLSDDQLGAIRRAFSSELRSAGYRTASQRSAAAQLRVSFSENFQNYLWVAQVRRGDARSVLMISVPRAPAAPTRNTSNLVISRKLLLSRDEPILDLALIAAPGQATPHLLVLGRASLALYETFGAAWQEVQTLPLADASPLPRDARGRLAVRADGAFTASLPGEQCLGSLNLLANLDCHASEEPWPVAGTPEGDATAAFVANRNYFTGLVLVPSHDPLPVPDFYSVAALESGKDYSWLVATTEGKVQLLSPRGNAVELPGWGSQLAVIKPACGSGVLILATRPGDFAQPDAIQAFQIRSRAGEAASAPVEFTGPVTLLRAASEEGAALAVVHALPTGLYETYRLSITCSD